MRLELVENRRKQDVASIGRPSICSLEGSILAGDGGQSSAFSLTLTSLVDHLEEVM